MVSDPTSNPDNDLPKISVLISQLKAGVSVLILHDNDTTGGGMAPDTRHAEIFITVDRGRNYHGSLREEFFICRDDGDAPDSTVLWVTLNASQAEDDVQRLEPFCMLRVDWRPCDLDDETAALIESFDELELEGAILMWAYANYVLAWDEDWFAGAKFKDGTLSSRAAGLIIEAGASGKPLDLLQLKSATESF